MLMLMTANEHKWFGFPAKPPGAQKRRAGNFAKNIIFIG
jgi:hypothetical protein